MSGFNKATSFILGLIVVLVFLFVFGSRVNLSDKLIAFKNIKVTPTPTVAATITPTPKKGFFESLFARKATPTPTPKLAEAAIKGTATTNTGSSTGTTAVTPQTIPQTGSPTILFPILVSALGSGIYLRKKN